MITVFTGPMFSGKSSKLIEIYANNFYNDKIIAFKPTKDTRDKTKIKCRQYSLEIEAIGINCFEDILKHLKPSCKVILIDEAQFLTGDTRIILDLSLEDYEIYIAGLSLDSEQKGFGKFPKLMAIADKIETITADCYYCGKKALYTRYIGQKDNQVLVGSKGYISICKECLKKEVL